MNVEQYKQKIAELEAQLKEVRADSELKGVERARKITEIAGELKRHRAELVEVEEAEAALADADKPALEVVAEGGDGTETPVEVPAEGGDTAPAETAPAEDAAPVALAASASDDDDKGGEFVPPVRFVAASTNAGTEMGANLGQDQILTMLQASSKAGTGRQSLLKVSRFNEADEAVHANKSAIENSRIIANARQKNLQPTTLTAAACFCGPDQIKADFGVIGQLGRPVAGLFPTIPIATGGFTYYPDIAINPDSGSVNLWDCTAQAAVDPNDDSTWKHCSELDCFTPQSALAYMVTACTIVQKTHQWAHPEQVNTWLDKLRLEYDRLAEVALLNIIDDAAGTPLTVGAAAGGMLNFGIKAQIEYALAELSFSLGYQFRAAGLAGHTVITPRGLIDAMVADEHIRGFDRGASRAEIVRSVFEDYGVTLVERLDEPNRDGIPAAATATVTALNAGGAIDAQGVEPAKTPLRPAFSRLYVLRPDQWVHAEGTMVNADWHTDTALLRQNRMLYFWENVELLVQTGLEKPHIVDIYGPINGARADLVTPPA